ncbi:hypothetical protein Tco_0438220 [Tanacetum coccineum]
MGSRCGLSSHPDHRSLIAKETIGLGRWCGDNTSEGGDSSSDGEGIWGSGEDHKESGDDGGVDIARSLATSASDHTGVGTGAGIEILAVTRYARCGGGVAADSSVSNGSVSSADGGLISSW